jgi:hypothetical protein
MDVKKRSLKRFSLAAVFILFAGAGAAVGLKFAPFSARADQPREKTYAFDQEDDEFFRSVNAAIDQRVSYAKGRLHMSAGARLLADPGRKVWVQPLEAAASSPAPATAPVSSEQAPKAQPTKGDVAPADDRGSKAG